MPRLNILLGLGLVCSGLCSLVENVWKELDAEEINGVATWLLKQPELNLSRATAEGAWSNTIVLIELQRPNKTDVLPFIQGNGIVPPRHARAVLRYGATVEPYFMDVLVGPLPASNQITSWTPLHYPLTRKTGGKVRNLQADRLTTIYQDWLSSVGRSVADITLYLLGGTASGLSNDTLSIVTTVPYGQTADGRVVNWYLFRGKPTGNFDSATLLPSGLYFRADITGRDPNRWKIERWLYNNKVYRSADELSKACFSPGFEKLGMNVDGDWTSTDQQGPVASDTQSPPPISVVDKRQPRYLLDTANGYVSWMGFSFYLGFSLDTGLGLFGVEFQSTSVLYELSLQESLAHYAGHDPFQSSSAPLDSANGLGLKAFELVPGYDCPSHSEYLNTTYFTADRASVHQNTICIFENTADSPMQRHMNRRYATASRKRYLTVRWCSTMDNYDFIFSYTFFMDGTIQVLVEASGYIVAQHYANSADHGFRIHDSLSGSMHDHVYNFKADFDVLGTVNTVQLVKIAPSFDAYTWSEGEKRSSMRLERSILDSEDIGRWDWSSNDDTMFLIVNQDRKNDFGEARGWRIQRGSEAVHLTIHNSPVLADAARWAEHDIHITRQHDWEPRSAHPHNDQDVHNPPVNFDKFFDSESLTQSDLVVWFNLGMHHVPTAADLPNTLTTFGHSSIRFTPHNLFSAGQSRQSTDRVRIDYDQDRVRTIDTFGQQNVTACLAVALNDYGRLGNYKGVFGRQH